jgi:hypothetical protein
MNNSTESTTTLNIFSMLYRYKYTIALVIAAIVVLILVMLLFKKKSKSSVMASGLTGLIQTPTTYTVDQKLIADMNENIPQSNYAIAIWQYLDKWELTKYPKLLVAIPGVFQMAMGETTNDLTVTIYGAEGFEGFYSLATNYGVLTPIADSVGLITTTPSDFSSQDGPPPPTNETWVKDHKGSNHYHPPTGDNTWVKDWVKDHKGSSHHPPTEDNSWVKDHVPPPTPPPYTPPPDRTPPNINVDTLAENTVYKYIDNDPAKKAEDKYENTYIFVYNTFVNDAKTSKWREVRVAFSTSKVEDPVSIDDLYRGGTTNSFVLETKPPKTSHTKSSIPYNIANSVADCHQWVWSCKPRPSDDTCTNTTSITKCFPHVSSAIITPYPQSTNQVKTAAVYTIIAEPPITDDPPVTPPPDKPFFENNQYFTFYYYDDNQMPVVISPSKKLQTYSAIETMAVMYPSDFTSYPTELLTPSTLFSYREENNIVYGSSIKEPLENVKNPYTTMSYKIPNMPLQTWTHILVNVSGRNLTIYIDGKINMAFILPMIPVQMNNEIHVTPSPSIEGLTSTLQYVPSGVTSDEAFNIYNKGHLSKSASSGKSNFWSRYSINLNFIDKFTK